MKIYERHNIFNLLYKHIKSIIDFQCNMFSPTIDELSPFLLYMNEIVDVILTIIPPLTTYFFTHLVTFTTCISK